MSWEDVADVSFLPQNERNETWLIVSSWFRGLGFGCITCFLIRVPFVKFSLFVDLWLWRRWFVEGNGIVSILSSLRSKCLKLLPLLFFSFCDLFQPVADVQAVLLALEHIFLLNMGLLSSLSQNAVKIAFSPQDIWNILVKQRFLSVEVCLLIKELVS